MSIHCCCYFDPGDVALINFDQDERFSCLLIDEKSRNSIVLGVLNIFVRAAFPELIAISDQLTFLAPRLFLHSKVVQMDHTLKHYVLSPCGIFYRERVLSG